MLFFETCTLSATDDANVKYCSSTIFPKKVLEKGDRVKESTGSSATDDANAKYCSSTILPKKFFKKGARVRKSTGSAARNANMPLRDYHKPNSIQYGGKKFIYLVCVLKFALSSSDSSVPPLQMFIANVRCSETLEKCFLDEGGGTVVGLMNEENQRALVLKVVVMAYLVDVGDKIGMMEMGKGYSLLYNNSIVA